MSERIYQPESGAREYFFGDWRLCVNTNSLERGDLRVELENRLVLLLIFFIEHPGEVLGKERILTTIWQGKVVNEDSLAVAISHLRKALGDNSRAPRYIKTIPGVGYQFISPVDAAGRAVALSSQAPASDIPVMPAAAQAPVWRHKYSLVFVGILLMVCAFLVPWLYPSGERSVAALEPDGAGDRFARLAPSLAGNEPAELKSAIQSLRQLLQSFPDFAPAYVAIAEAKIKLLQDQLIQPENCAEVFGLANKAITLGMQSAQAYVLRANLQFWCARDYRRAEQDYQRAIALEPGNDHAPLQYAQLLLAQGKFAESLQQVGQARRLNPLNYPVPTVVWIYQMQHLHDAALAELERINRAEPADRYFHISAQRVYAALGREEESLEHWLWLMRDAGYREADIQAAKAAAGEGGLAAVNLWLLARRDDADLGQYQPPLSWARYALAAGQLDLALDYLEQAAAKGQSPLLWAQVDPAYDPVREHPRFQALVQQLQLPVVAMASSLR